MKWKKKKKKKALLPMHHHRMEPTGQLGGEWILHRELQSGTAKLTKLSTHIHRANARQLDAATYQYRNRNRKTPFSPAPSLTGTNYLMQAASTEAFKRKIPLCSVIFFFFFFFFFFFLFFFLLFVHRLSTPEWGWMLCVWPLFIQPGNINTCSFW